jgi:tetratricopeptide (TPR) repeat protein
MLTIKNRAGCGLVGRRWQVWFSRFSPFGFIFFLAFLSACTPAGPRALLEGKRLIDQGKYQQAIQKLEKATSLLSGTNALAWNYLGVAYQHAGADTEAQRAYERAWAFNHDLSEIRFNLGCLWLGQNKLDAARADFTVYTALRPNAPEGFLKLGTTQLRSREPGAAEKSFNEALRLSPRNPEAFNGLGLARLQRGRAAEAAQYFASALEQQPHYPPALLNLAIVSQQYLRDRKSALQRYRECLALKPPPADATTLAAIVRQLEQELNPTAGQAATNAAAQPNLSANPAKPPATNATRMASAPKAEPVMHPPKSDTTQPQRSETAPELLKPAAPGNAEVVKRAEEVMSTAAPAHPSSRVPPGRYAYESPPQPAHGNRSDAELSFARAALAEQAHRLPEAIQAYRLAVRQDPSLFQAQYNLSRVATEAGDLPLALRSYESALAIKPTSLDARYNFGLVLKQSNYLSDAVNELEKVVTIDPNQTRAHLALGKIYSEQLRQPAKARQHYLKVLEVEPHYPQAGAIRAWLAANPP